MAEMMRSGRSGNTPRKYQAESEAIKARRLIN
jgi:hypothetical protein